MAHPLTKEEVEKAKQKQRGIISDCDKAIADCQNNIATLNSVMAQQNTTRKLAEDTLADLQDDFPTASGVTTAPGAPDGTSLVDASLVGNTTVAPGLVATIWPDDASKRESQVIKAFDVTTGVSAVSAPFKGGQVPANVPHKINPAIPS